MDAREIAETTIRELCSAAARLLSDALVISPDDQDIKRLLLGLQVRGGTLIPADPPSWRAKLLVDEVPR